MVLTQREIDDSNRRITTVAQAALLGRTLRLECPFCHRVRLLDAVAVWWMCRRKRWGEGLREVGQHFWCELCWRGRHSSHRAVITVVSVQPEGDQPPPPPTVEWKKFVRLNR